MAKNIITIEVPQLEAIGEKLDAILAALKNIGTPFSATLESTQPLEVSEQVPEADPQATADTTPEEKPVEAEKTAVYKVTLADIQKKVVGLSAKGLRDQVKEIVQSYAVKVSDIPADKFDEVMDRLVCLEG